MLLCVSGIASSQLNRNKTTASKPEGNKKIIQVTGTRERKNLSANLKRGEEQSK